MRLSKESECDSVLLKLSRNFRFDLLLVLVADPIGGGSNSEGVHFLIGQNQIKGIGAQEQVERHHSGPFVAIAKDVSCGDAEK